MKTSEKLSFYERIQWRIRLLWGLLIAMLVYMVVVGEMGLGDSRVITHFADTCGTLMFFGTLGWLIWRIRYNRQLLGNPWLLKQKHLDETDERNRYLHDKSGGIVWDILFVCLFFVTMTASLWNMAAFYATFTVFVIAVLLKVCVYFHYSRG